MAGLGRDLDVAETFLLRIFCCFFSGDSSGWQITLVADHHHHDFLLAILFYFLVPAVHFFESFSACEIEAKESSGSTLEEDASDSLELLLPKSVPDVELSDLSWNGVWNVKQFVLYLDLSTALLVFIELIVDVP